MKNLKDENKKLKAENAALIAANLELNEKFNNIVDEKYTAEKYLKKSMKEIKELKDKNKKLKQEIEQLNKSKTE